MRIQRTHHMPSRHRGMNQSTIFKLALQSWLGHSRHVVSVQQVFSKGGMLFPAHQANLVLNLRVSVRCPSDVNTSGPGGPAKHGYTVVALVPTCSRGMTGGSALVIITECQAIQLVKWQSIDVGRNVKPFDMCGMSIHLHLVLGHWFRSGGCVSGKLLVRIKVPVHTQSSL